MFTSLIRALHLRFPRSRLRQSAWQWLGCQIEIQTLEDRTLLSSAPLAWSAGANLPSPQGGVVAVQFRGSTVVLGGTTGSVTVFGATDPSWQTVVGTAANSLGSQGLTSPGVGVTPDGLIFVFGGQSGTTVRDSSLHYDTTIQDNVNDGPTLSTPRYGMGFATDESGNIYAIGGTDDQGSVLASMEYYKPSTDTWNAAAPLPTALTSLSAVADGAGHVFAFGGIDAAGHLSSAVYRYTIASNSWDAVASLPVATDNSAAILGSNGKMYVLGGVTSSGTTANVESYDETTNTWSTETALPAPVSSEAVTVDALGRIVVAGGFDANGLATAAVSMSQQLNQADTAPVFTSTPVLQAASSGTYTYQVLSTGNPQPTYSLTAAPQGMAIDPGTGLITWTPQASESGAQSVTVVATNFAGQATQGFTINIAAPTITSNPVLTAVADSPYTYQVKSTANPSATYSLASAPTGMTIDPVSGIISWVPADSQIGPQSVTVEASNVVGSTTQTYPLNVLAPAPSVPTGLTAVGASTTSIQLNWNASTVVGGGVTYDVYRKGFIHSPRGSGGTVTYTLIGSGITSTSFVVGGLTVGASATYLVSAVNTSSHLESARSAEATGQTLYPPSLWGATLNGALISSASVEAGQSVQIKILAYGNEAPTFSIIGGPSTMSVDPVTGVVTYAPAASEVGYTTVTFQATNSVGTATESFTFHVLAQPTVQVTGGTFEYNGTAPAATAIALGTDGVTQISGTFTFQYELQGQPNTLSTAPYASVGVYTAIATFTSSDPNYGGATGTGTITIVAPATQLVFQQAPPSAGTAGAAFSPDVTVALEDSQGNIVTADSSTVTLALSSGTFAGGGNAVSAQAVNGVATFSNLAINQAGTYTITASDGVLPTLKSSSVIISPAAASQLAFQAAPTKGTAGTLLGTVKAAVEDQFGNIETTDNSTVTLNVATGPGSFTNGSTLTATAVNGIATFTNLVLDTSGGYTLGASDGTLTAAVSGTLTISPAAATHLALLQQPATGTAGVALSPAVKVAVEDAFGNIVTASSAVTLTLATGKFSNNSTTATANTIAGVATFSSLIINLPGTYTLSATDGALLGTSLSVAINPAAARKLVFQQAPPTAGTAGVPFNSAVTVAVEDNLGNIVTSDSSTVTLTLSTGTFANGSKSSAVQAVNGIATFSGLAINRAGTFTITATDGTLTSVKSANIVISPAAATKLVFQAIPTTGTAGVALVTVKVAVEDQFGNIVTSNNSTITITAATGPGAFTAGSTVSVAAVNGVASFSNLILNTSGKYTFGTSDGSLASAVSGTVTINAAAAAKLVILQQPATGTAGTALAPAVKVGVEDAFGNLVSTASTVTLTLNTGKFSTNLTTATANTSGGVATFSNLIIDVAGAYTLAATDGALAGTSLGVTINPAAAKKLVFLQAPPATGNAGVSFSPDITVAVEDVYGNIVTSDASTITLTLSAGTFSSGSKTIAVQVVKGVATFSNLAIASKGTYTITASDGTLTTVKSGSIVIS